MRKFWEDLRAKLENELLQLEMKENDQIRFYKKSIGIIRKALEDLRHLVLEHGFGSDEEEIIFFKNVKPSIVQQLIYYSESLTIESRRPPGNKEFNVKYYNLELDRMNRFCIENMAYWQYHITGESSLDKVYFTRDGADRDAFFDAAVVNIDKHFSTSYDFLFAKLSAYEKLSNYYNIYIRELETGAPTRQLKKEKLVWTGSKAAIVELIYGLHSCGVINNGNVEVKQIAAFFEEYLNVQIGNWYRAFQDMRERKANRTIFIDLLKTKVLQRMDETDKNYKGI
jgi:hypothetical protein